LKARQKATSDSYPTLAAMLAMVSRPARKRWQKGPVTEAQPPRRPFGRRGAF
jgi:hypothetical protein